MSANNSRILAGEESLLWYKNSVIYQLHVRSFHDGNNDGIGDFQGLLEKLDYLQWLGVTTIWLLPFYPSPLRDDGYDVSDYCAVNPSYGTMRDFRAFVREAHARGLRVITELILNHTSDQHPWFQRARRAKRGSKARNYYVWSDTDTLYSSTRIIFTDTEISNWAWDPVANQYYWHRFFSHQPDLNYDNPDVIREMIQIMRFWFRIGVDGLRLDAAPYLCVKEGTTNENIPETHEVIKKLRAFINEEFPGRILLAEANQWPEDVQTYFGDADECQMAYHFPLMPRLFLSLATQDRFPIYDIMQQTPEIPETCQWAIFLRNHDEMTLEMVTDRERAFMYEIYAPEHHTRINVGIRRRLAPLLGNDRRKIELLMSLLLSMPGTPILYYGDEIGMGDNVFLKDRDGVRTPMQWSPDRNGGFSQADAQQLCLPVIQDSLYGYEATNVEAQKRNTSSLLNWLRRLIGVRQSQRLFGEGRLTFLYPENRHIIAYFRELNDETVLCVANLADSAQAVSLDLSRYIGRTPIEMIGWSAFPRIGGHDYLITLPGNAFFWFLLRNDPALPEIAPKLPAPELATIVLPRGWHSLSSPASAGQLERSILPKYLPLQWWYGLQNEPPQSVKMYDMVELSDGDDGPVYTFMHIDDENGPVRTLFLDRTFDLLATPAAGLGSELAKGRTGPREFLIYDAASDQRPWLRLGRALLHEQSYQGRFGRIRCEVAVKDLKGLVIRADDPVRCVATDTVISAVIDGSVSLRLYRSVEAGVHPEVELAAALQAANYEHVPEFLGAIYYEREDGTSFTLGSAYRFVGNRGPGREIALGLLRQRLERGRLKPTPSSAGHRDDDGFGGFLRYATVIGQRIAEFHKALMEYGDAESFAPGSMDDAAAKAEIQETLALVPENLPKHTLLKRRIGEDGAQLTGQMTCRIHGNLSLSEIIVANEDIILVGLEGDTTLSLAERRRKRSPLVDLATMALSFDVVAEDIATHISSDRTEGADRLRPTVNTLAKRAREALYLGYEEITQATVARPLLQFFRIQALLREYAKTPAARELPLDALERLLQGVLHEGNNGAAS